MLRGSSERDSKIEYLPHSTIWILESENVTKKGALYKILKAYFDL